MNGYSIQHRVTTEDPPSNFLPDTGKISVYRSGSGNGMRLDGGNAYTGAEILPYYDSLLVKLISHDRTFEGAVHKSLRALKEMRCPWHQDKYSVPCERTQSSGICFR